MELERMRTVLAEGMGWKLWLKLEGIDNEDHWVRRLNPGERGYKERGGRHLYIMDASDWQPDANGLQTWTVIERMRELGWVWHVIVHTDGSARVSLHHRGGRQVNVAEYERLPEMHARMLCAARAMEANDEQKH